MQNMVLFPALPVIMDNPKSGTNNAMGKQRLFLRNKQAAQAHDA